MRGKYKSITSFAAAKARRRLLRTLLRGITSWKPLQQSEPGYTMVMACHGPLAEMILPNLDLLARQDLTALFELIIVFDRPRDRRLDGLAAGIVSKYPQLKPRFAFQSARQNLMLRRIGWGWVDCWLSYCKAIAATRTRYAMLHDMDAMLFRRDLMWERYQLIVERGDHFVGVCWYEGNGIVCEDRLAYIVEMALDVEYLRRTNNPLDLFNVVGCIDDRAVDYDTLLFPQTRTRRRSIAPVDEADMVHPSQVVSQFAALMRSRLYVPPEWNNVLMVPYFLYLAGLPESMDLVRQEIESATKGACNVISFFGRRMDLSRLSVIHASWLEKQSLRIEQAVAGRARTEVSSYFVAVKTFAESRVPGGLTKLPVTGSPRPGAFV